MMRPMAFDDPRPADVRSLSSADQAYLHIREKLIRGELEPGARLTEWQIAGELGTSRTPVREAMRRLVGDGYLRFQPNFGTFVRTWSAQEVGELFDLRGLLEAEIAHAAAQHMSTAQIERLRIIQDSIEAHGVDLAAANLLRISDLNRQFHFVIAEASRSARLVGMLTNAIEAPVVQQTFRRYSDAQLRRSFHHHRELIDAFDSHDAVWARDAMSCHIRAGRFVMVTALAGTTEVAPASAV